MNRLSVQSLICFAAAVSTSFLSLASETLVLRFRARRFLRLQTVHFFPQGLKFRLERVELIAPDKIQLGRKLVGLSAEGRFGFLARRLGKTQGRVRQLGKLIQEMDSESACLSYYGKTPPMRSGLVVTAPGNYPRVTNGRER
jgi:hypothetical protein